MTTSNVKWTGNPLALGGTRATCGGIVADLMKFDPMAMFGVEPSRLNPSAVRLRRSWLLYISVADGTYISEDGCLASMILPNLMPEAAKREAEQIIRWAAIARGDPSPTETVRT